MRRERLQANLFYLFLAAVLIYFFWVVKSDKAYPTGEYKQAVVESIAPHHSRLRAKKNVYIRTEDGIVMVRVVDMERNFRVGQELEVKEYRSKIRGSTKYEIVQ